MDKQKAIEQMATMLHGFACGGNCNNKKCKCNHFYTADRLANAGYGNINQALTEFAERLKEVWFTNACRFSKGENGIEIAGGVGVTIEQIDETLEEFLNDD